MRFAKMRNAGNARRFNRVALDTCVEVTALALSMVLAGTGDLNCLKLLRLLSLQGDGEVKGSRCTSTNPNTLCHTQLCFVLLVANLRSAYGIGHGSRHPVYGWRAVQPEHFTIRHRGSGVCPVSAMADQSVGESLPLASIPPPIRAGG